MEEVRLNPYQSPTSGYENANFLDPLWTYLRIFKSEYSLLYNVLMLLALPLNALKVMQIQLDAINGNTYLAFVSLIVCTVSTLVISIKSFLTKGLWQSVKAHYTHCGAAFSLIVVVSGLVILYQRFIGY